MTKTEIFKRVHGIAVERHPEKFEALGSCSEQSKIRDDGGLDSLDEIELILAVEDEYDIEISDDEIDGINTFLDLAEMVEMKLAAK